MKHIFTLPARFAPKYLIFYPAAWLAWFSILCWASSRARLPKTGIDIPHLDKVMHFSYFAAGAAVIAMGLLIFKNRYRPSLSKLSIFLICLIVGSATGVLDEYHQSFVEGRDGNDLGDMIADTLGSIAGCLYIFWASAHEKRSQPAK